MAIHRSIRRVWPLGAAAAGFWLGHSWSSTSNSSSHRATPASAPAAPRPVRSAAAMPSASSGAIAPEEAWEAMLSHPASPARDDALAARIQSLAASDPAGAFKLVRAQWNRLLRKKLTLALLRGWAASAPLDAAHWAMSASPDDREAALDAVFAGAVAAGPEAAVKFGTRLASENPADPFDCGTHLVDALCMAGDFDAAARVALGGEPNRRAALLGDAFSRWASYQPEQAANAAAAIADPTIRAEALHGIIGGWSDIDPAGAVQFANALPDGEPDRSAMVGQALLRWSKTDLKAASDWINGHELGAAMDGAVASIATHDYVKPDVAMSWAESVVDPNRRSETISAVLRRWATTDLPSARRYARATHQLLPADRSEIEDLFSTLGGNGS